MQIIFKKQIVFKKTEIFYNDFVEISFGITKRLSWDCNEEWENFRSIYRSLHKGELLSIIVSHSYVSILLTAINQFSLSLNYHISDT